MMLGYLCALGVAVLFMLYLDGEIGVMMLAFLLVMPLLSLGVTLWVRRGLTVRLELPDNCARQRPIPLRLVLEKKSVLPLPFLRLRLAADAHFAPLNPAAQELSDAPTRESGLLGFFRYQKAYRAWRRSLFEQLTPDVLPICCSMGIQHETSLELQLEGVFCGNGVVTASQMVVSDFLGMARFRKRGEVTEQVLLLPEIPQMKGNNELFRTVSNEVMTADEESDTTPIFSAASTAGYEHRDYIAGDSLRRINWKLSSKRHRLMVRMDEPVSLAKLSVVLDFRRAANPPCMAKTLAMEQQLIETALGLLRLCIEQGFPCILYFLDETAQWVSLTLDSPAQLATEAVTLLRGGYRPPDLLRDAPALPPALVRDGSTILLYFSAHPEASSSAALEQLPCETIYYVLPSAVGNMPKTLPKYASLWRTTEEHSLEPCRN